MLHLVSPLELMDPHGQCQDLHQTTGEQALVRLGSRPAKRKMFMALDHNAAQTYIDPVPPPPLGTALECTEHPDLGPVRGPRRAAPV